MIRVVKQTTPEFCMARLPFYPPTVSISAVNRILHSSLLGVAALVAALSLAGCDRQSTSHPGSMPAKTGSGTSSGGNSPQPGTSSGVEVRTPAAPDSRGGGSSGSKGVAPIPDTSGVPSSGSNSPGAGNASTVNNASVDGPNNGQNNKGTVPVTPPVVSTNGGLPASSLANSGTSSGNTNSTPQSSTGNAAR